MIENLNLFHFAPRSFHKYLPRRGAARRPPRAAEGCAARFSYSAVDPCKFYVKNSPSCDLKKSVSEFELKANDEKDLEKWILCLKSAGAIEKGVEKSEKTMTSTEKKLLVGAGAAVGAVGLGAAAVVAAPFVLAGAGFTTAGVAAGSLAAGVQSMIGAVGAGSVFAGLQSAGAVGLSSAALAGTGVAAGTVGAAAGAVVGGAVVADIPNDEHRETGAETAATGLWNDEKTSQSESKMDRIKPLEVFYSGWIKRWVEVGTVPSKSRSSVYEEQFFVIENGRLNWCKSDKRSSPLLGSVTLAGAVLNKETYLNYFDFSLKNNTGTRTVYFRLNEVQQSEWVAHLSSAGVQMI